MNLYNARTPLRRTLSRVALGVGSVATALMVGTGTAHAITQSDCTDGGGIVVRCATQPVTKEDKITCETPGKTTKIWCVGGFYDGLEILDLGGDTKYQ